MLDDVSILDLLDGTIPPRRYNIIISRSFPGVKVRPLSIPNLFFDASNLLIKGTSGISSDLLLRALPRSQFAMLESSDHVIFFTSDSAISAGVDDSSPTYTPLTVAKFD